MSMNRMKVISLSPGETSEVTKKSDNSLSQMQLLGVIPYAYYLVF